MEIPGQLTELQVRILKYLYERRPGLVRDDEIFRVVGEGKVPFQSGIEKSLPYLVQKGYISREGRHYKILAKGIDYIEAIDKD